MKNFNERVKTQLATIQTELRKEREAFARFCDEKQAELDALEIERQENEKVIAEAVISGDSKRWTEAVMKRKYYLNQKEFLENEMRKRPEVSEKAAEKLRELNKIREELSEKMKARFPYVIREAIKEDQEDRKLCDEAKQLYISANFDLYGTNGIGLFDSNDPGSCFDRVRAAVSTADIYDSPEKIWANCFK